MRRGGRGERASDSRGCGGGENLNDCWRARLYLYYYLPTHGAAIAINFHGNVRALEKQRGKARCTKFHTQPFSDNFHCIRFVLCLKQTRQASRNIFGPPDVSHDFAYHCVKGRGMERERWTECDSLLPICLFVIYQAPAGVCKAENKSQT